MPKYEIQAPDGRTLEIEGASMPSAAQLQSIFAKVGGKSAAPRKPASPADFTDGPKAPQGSAAGRFASGAWDMVNPLTIAKGIGGAIAHPIDTASGLIAAQAGEFGKAKDAYDEGRYSEMIGHGAAGLLPVLGPAAAAKGEQIASGDIAGGLGGALGLVAPIGVARDAAKGVARAIPPKALTRLQKLKPTIATQTPEAAAAVQWALDQGVPVDAATATGNRVVRGVKDVSDRSIGGLVVGNKAAAMRAESMAKVGKGLAAKASPAVETAETAGAAVRGSVEGVIKREAGNAATAYGKVRAGAEPLVDLTGTKAALKPIYDQLLKKRELTGQLQGAEGRAAVALDALVGGADSAPLSVVDAALGDIKSMARGADMPELRTQGQGLAAEAVTHLEGAVQAAAKQAGVWDDLRAGRDATIAKWTAAETLDKLKAEPVQTFRAMTQHGDAGIERLREVKKLAPGDMPKIGRAYLEDAIDTATAEGGFGHEAKLWADWQKLGDETKALIFPDQGLRGDLDKFFLVGKKMAENSNPSGSGYTAVIGAQGAMLYANPVGGAALVLSSAALSKALNSPKVAKLLTTAMQTPRTAPAARSLGARLKVALRPAVSTAQANQGLAPQPQSSK